MHIERFGNEIDDALCPKRSAIDHGLKIVGVSYAILHIDQPAELHDVGEALRW